MSEQSTIHIVLRKDNKWGRTLYYTTKKEDVWLPVIYNQQSLTQHRLFKNDRKIFIWINERRNINVLHNI